MSFRERYGPWALVAGASEGIGAAFARALAARGLGVVLVARRPEPLAALAREIEANERVPTRVVTLDLASPDFQEALARETDALDIGLVVSNAALSIVAPFFRVPLSDLLRTIDLNCRAPLVLAHTFGQRMAARGRGGFICMSSLAGVYGGPFVATYAASKAFSLVLSESLSCELAPLGVDVIACVAGPTRTPTFARSQPSAFPPPMRPEAVVEAALSGLSRHGPRVIPGLFHRATSRVLGLLPRTTVLSLVSRQTRRFGGGLR